MINEHQLVNNRLSIEDKNETVKGVVARCICGWHSGYHFSSFAASNAFSAHLEEAVKDLR